MEIKFTMREVSTCLVFVMWLAPAWLATIDGWRYFLMVAPDYLIEWDFARAIFTGVWSIAGLGVVAHLSDEGLL